MLQTNQETVNKWEPVLEGISNEYTRQMTAQLLENQAKSIIAESQDRVDEAGAPTTVGKLGTFQKFAFPLIRRVFPQLIANSIVGIQPMQGPVSQIFYIGHDRHVGATTSRTETVFSKFNLTYGGNTASAIMEAAANTNHAADALADGTSGFGALLADGDGNGDPLNTMGGRIAAWPDENTILGYSVSAGEALKNDEIPELNMHIEQQPVVARTRKMRALWTLEAAQDLRAYHALDLEGELTDLLSKELTLEIDRELIEDLRMIAYDPSGLTGWNHTALDNANSNNFGSTGNLHAGLGSGGSTPQDFIPEQYLYDFANNGTSTAGTDRNVFLVDLRADFGASPFAPQHLGHVYANLLAQINFVANDIYRTTFRGPGTVMITSPLVASMLESAAKLEGGMAAADKPTNMGSTIEYRGKFAGRYDLFVDPMYPEDEIFIGYKGQGPMDAGYVYCPYIPLQQLPTITDPTTFQPRKGILTRYGKAAVSPASRFYRIIRLVGADADYMFTARKQPSQSVYNSTTNSNN